MHTWLGTRGGVTPHRALALGWLLAACDADAGGSAVPDAGGAPDGGADPAGTGGFDVGDLMLCDPDVTEPTRCGDLDCEPLSAGAPLLCRFSCCTDTGACGVRTAFAGQPSTCAPAPQPDPRCPDGQSFTGAQLSGCCTEANECGLLVSNPLLTRCTARSLFSAADDPKLIDCDGAPLVQPGADSDRDAGL